MAGKSLKINENLLKFCLNFRGIFRNFLNFFKEKFDKIRIFFGILFLVKNGGKFFENSRKFVAIFEDFFEIFLIFF
jgi:hypothetical protein